MLILSSASRVGFVPWGVVLSLRCRVRAAERAEAEEYSVTSDTGVVQRRLMYSICVCGNLPYKQ